MQILTIQYIYSVYIYVYIIKFKRKICELIKYNKFTLNKNAEVLVKIIVENLKNIIKILFDDIQNL
jgi:hypothetical protein